MPVRIFAWDCHMFTPFYAVYSTVVWSAICPPSLKHVQQLSPKVPVLTPCLKSHLQVSKQNSLVAEQLNPETTASHFRFKQGMWNKSEKRDKDRQTSVAYTRTTTATNPPIKFILYTACQRGKAKQLLRHCTISWTSNYQPQLLSQ